MFCSHRLSQSGLGKFHKYLNILRILNEPPFAEDLWYVLRKVTVEISEKYTGFRTGWNLAMLKISSSFRHHAAGTKHSAVALNKEWLNQSCFCINFSIMVGACWIADAQSPSCWGDIWMSSPLNHLAQTQPVNLRTRRLVGLPPTTLATSTWISSYVPWMCWLENIAIGSMTLVHSYLHVAWFLWKNVYVGVHI